MPTDDERREVARRLREFAKDKWSLTVGGNSSTIRYAISDIVFGDKKYHSGVDLLDRLADLIEPVDGFDLDTVQRVCLERMDGCDEPEWTLYTTVYGAIARYKRGDSGPSCNTSATHLRRVTDASATVEVSQRDALLALVDEMEQETGSVCGVCMGKSARRIREALGVES